MKIPWRRGLVAAAAAAIVVVNPALAQMPADGPTAVPVTPGTTVYAGVTPAIVLNHQATFLGAHDPAAPLEVDFGLPLRNQAALHDFIVNEAGHGIYLTNAQFDAQFGATTQQVQAVEGWGATHALQMAFVSDDGILLSFRASTSAVEAALGVQINNYRAPNGRLFYANASDPTLPASLGVAAITGLNDIPHFHTLHQAALPSTVRAAAFRSGGYYPSDFRTAYDLAGHGYDGTGQTIGFTLWGNSVANSDLSHFCGTTSDACMSSGTGADQIEWLKVGTETNNYQNDALVETALDVEYGHGMAQHAHLKYWLGDQSTTFDFTCGCYPPTDSGLEHAISAAANDASVHMVSDSWGGGEAGASDLSNQQSFVYITDQSFQHAVAVGTTFYFSSGDSGTDSGGTGLASYPADDPYVVSVGGTALQTGGSFSYGSESVWNTQGGNPSEGGGAGCSTVFAQPSYQSGVVANQHGGCAMRAEPDVSADADPNTGAWVYVQGSGNQIGGTSLASPLFMGMMAVADDYASLTGHARVGWANPTIYNCGFNTIAGCSSTFHDVTTGTTNGSIHYNAVPGWDQATGWGSIDWWNFVRAINGSGGSPTPTNTATPSNTPSNSPTRTNTPNGPTATPTNTPPSTSTPTNTPTVPTNTRTNTPTTTPTQSGGGNGIANGGFESGNLSGWSTSVNNAGGNAESPPVVSTTYAHAGTYSALVGGNGSPEPNGDACLYQNFSTTGGTFSFYYMPFTTDSITYDWQEAYLRASGTMGCSASGTQIFKVASNGGAWTPVTQSVGAGSYQAYFNVHEDGYGDDTYMYVDDVSMSGGGNPTPTNTPPPPTNTLTRTPTNTPSGPTSTNTPAPPTATWTNTPTNTPTSTRTNTPTPSPTQGSGGALVNGSFEAGNLSGWSTSVNNAGGNAESPPVVSTTYAHSGTHAALVGGNGSPEPNGDACLYQNFSTNVSHAYGFYYLPFSTDSITYDWQEAYLRASGTNGCAESGTRLFKVASNSGAWTHVTHTVTAGSYQAYFNVHEDGYGDDTYMYVDDVS